MLPLRNFACASTQTLPQLPRFNKLHDCRRALLNVSRLDQQRRFLIREHLTDLSQAAGDDCFSHRHVFKNLCRRSKELTSIRKRHMRRNEYVTSIEQRRDSIVAHRTREDHLACEGLRLQLLLDFCMQTPASDE